MKFKLKQEVKAKGDNQIRKIIGMIVDEDGSIVYKVTSREVDVQAKELVNGVAFFKEVELEEKK